MQQTTITISNHDVNSDVNSASLAGGHQVLSGLAGENWEFDENGLMAVRHASINDLPIAESDRKYHWPQGRRPDEHPGLTELGL